MFLPLDTWTGEVGTCVGVGVGRRCTTDARRATSRAKRRTDLAKVLVIRATKPHRQARRSSEQRRKTHGLGAPALSLGAALAPFLPHMGALQQQYQQGSTVSTHAGPSIPWGRVLISTN